jgi:hypothetical protein
MKASILTETDESTSIRRTSAPASSTPSTIGALISGRDQDEPGSLGWVATDGGRGGYSERCDGHTLRATSADETCQRLIS